MPYIIIINLLSNLRPNLLRIESMHVQTTRILLRIVLGIVIRILIVNNIGLEIRDSTYNRRYSHSTDADRYSIGISIGMCNSCRTLILNLLLMRIII